MITLLEYDEQRADERELAALDASVLFATQPTVMWLNVDGLSRADVMEQLGVRFGLHPLVLEDMVNTSQRPKIEDFGSYVYIVLRMLYPSELGEDIVEEQVSLVLGPSYVISVQERSGDVFAPIRTRIKAARGRIRTLGADYLAYSLLDATVDSYFLVLEKLGDRLELLEDELITDPTPATLHTIHDLKTQLMFLRKSVWPLREVIHGLERGESTLVRESTTPYLRDVYDHTIQVIDTIESFHDVVAGMLDIYLSMSATR
jgi:magnesium transporter